MGEEALARRFEHGLNSKIRMLVTPLNLSTVAEVLHRAIICEQESLHFKKEMGDGSGGIIMEKERLLLSLAVQLSRVFGRKGRPISNNLPKLQ